jgi:O-antigen/teichoic acid export membrane protein
MSGSASQPIVTTGPSSTEGLRTRLLRGFSWNLVATAFNQGSTLVANIALANLWGLQVFGEYAIVQSTLAALTAVIQPTAGAAAIKYVAELRRLDPERAGRILGLCSVVALVIAVLMSGALVLGAHRLASGVLQAPGLAPALMVAGLAVFSTVMSGFLTGALAGLESYPALGKASIFIGSFYVAACIAGGWAWGLVGAVTGLAGSSVVQFAILAMLLRSEAARHGIRVRHRQARQELSVLFKFLTPAAFSSLIAFPAVWFLPAILGNVAVSLMNQQRGAADERRFRRIFWTNLGAGAALVVGAGLAVVLAGPWLLGRFGTAYRAGTGELLILLLAAIPETLAIAILQVLQAQERVWLTFFGMVLPGYGSLIVFAGLLTAKSGAEGLALVLAVWIVSRVGLWERPATARA